MYKINNLYVENEGLYGKMFYEKVIVFEIVSDGCDVYICIL